MPAERVSMRRVREILRLKHDGAPATGRSRARSSLARSTVALTLERVAAAGLRWPLPATLSDRVLEAMLFAGARRQQGARRKTEPDWADVHRELRRPGVTLMLLWEEYRQREPDGYGYSRWCELYRAWEGRLSPTMRQVHPAGERLFVDYAGQTVELVDGRHRRGAPGADLRRGDGRLELHLRRGDAGRRACRTGSARTSARSPSWAACRRSWCRTTRRSASTRANWYEPGLNRDLPRPGDALRHGDPADARAQAARQGEGRGRRAGGRALDPGAAAQPALLLAGRAQRGDRRAGRRPQRAADAPARRQPPRAVRSNSTVRR